MEEVQSLSLEEVFGKKKRRQRKEPSSEPAVSTNFEYSYEWLMKRVYETVAPPVTKKPFKLPNLELGFLGTTKTVWSNFYAICKTVNRDPEHMMSFFLAEMATTGSINGEGGLVLARRWKRSQVAKILGDYLKEYLICKSCKGSDTVLEKENRLLFTKCSNCGSRRATAPITKFIATTRQSRRHQREN